MDLIDPAEYEPTSAALIIVKSRLSAKSWVARVKKAQFEARAMDKIMAHVQEGRRLGAAIKLEVPPERRSWVLRHFEDYKRIGWEALVDERLPREPKIAKDCGKLIESAREANPKIGVDAVLAILRGQKVKHLPSPSTIRVHFKRVDRRLGRRREKERAPTEVIEMSLAGGELLLAAELETGAIAALTSEVAEISEEAIEASGGLVPAQDTQHRDGMGHFTAEYNQARARKEGESIAAYLQPAEVKAQGRVPSWPRFVHERSETIEAKLKALTFAPLIAETQGWDSLRAPSAAELGSLAGFSYMPSTLYKFTSALAISGAGSRMLEAMGKNWHRVASERWDEAGAMAALYVDNHAKEVWTSLFTMSGKVSSLNRVMPCITTTYIHTGAGTPIVASVQSGSAPLAPRLLELVENAERVLGDSVARATIIDAEGSVFDVLAAFSEKKRTIVTPLRPSRMPELEITYSPGSYYRPYREHDELRVAQVKLHHRSTGRTLELGALLVRRKSRESETILLTTGLQNGFSGRELADLYYLRWPLQENAFKDGAVVGLDRHRGNSARMVTNVAVVTELEKLKKQREQTESDLEARKQAEKEEVRVFMTAQREHRAAQSRLSSRRGRMDALIEAGQVDGRTFSRLAVESHEAHGRADAAARALAQAEVKLEATRQKIQAQDLARTKQAERERKLASRQEIRQLDTALDSILTSTKLTGLLLISFVLREYLPSLAMTPQTFVSRVFGTRGRRELRAEEESVVFYANKRDPEVTAALERACLELNSRGLKRDGRRLKYSVESAPA